MDRSFGLLFNRLLDTFPSASVVSIAGILPVITSVKMLLAPLTTLLCERTGYRVVCALGGLCYALGIIGASQAASFSLFYAAIMVSGVGAGFIYCPALCLVLKYFDRRRSVANGIGMTGPYFLIPILMEYLVETYGFRGGLLIYGGICLHVVLTGCVMKDIKVLGEGPSRQTKPFIHYPKSDQKKRTTTTATVILLLTHPSLVIVCLSMLLHFLGIWPIYLVFPQFVSSTIKSSFSSSRASFPATSASSLTAAWLLAVMSASEVIARPLVGACLDLPIVRPHLKWVLVASLLVTGGASFAISGLAFLHASFAGWIIYSVLFGFFNSLLTTHGLVLIADSFHRDQVPVATSIFQFSKGVGGCVGPIVAGFILDRTASFADCFYFSATATSVAGFVLAFYGLEKWRRDPVDDVREEGGDVIVVGTGEENTAL